MNEFNKDINSRRYARHIVLPEIGATGQARLADASVLVIGAGGLGSASLSYLAAMGIGRIGIVDDDRVELSNLQRQTLFETADIGRLKVQAAKDRLQELNPDCRVDIFPEQFPHASIDVSRYDLVLDGSDNFATRFAVNDACVQSRITLISAAISGFQGQIFTVKPHGPCVRCFIPDLPEKGAYLPPGRRDWRALRRDGQLSGFWRR